MPQIKPFNWYGREDAVAVCAGQKADASCDIVDDLAAEEVIVPGTFVMRGTDPQTQCKKLTAAGTMAGVAVHKHIDPLYNGNGYEVGYQVPIMRMGRIYMLAGAAVAAGDRVTMGADASHVVKAATGKTIMGRAITKATAAEDLIIVEIVMDGASLA